VRRRQSTICYQHLNDRRFTECAARVTVLSGTSMPAEPTQ
jgi:hypothetical protein